VKPVNIWEEEDFKIELDAGENLNNILLEMQKTKSLKGEKDAEEQSET
jgi:hypothetical protein